MSSNSAAEFANGDNIFIISNSAVMSFTSNNQLAISFGSFDVANTTAVEQSSNSAIIVSSNTFHIQSNNFPSDMGSVSANTSQIESTTITFTSNTTSQPVLANAEIIRITVNRPISTLDRAGELLVKQVWIG